MIYLDHAATTPLPRAVADAMYRCADASSSAIPPPSTLWARRPSELVEGHARQPSPGHWAASRRPCYFTSCGTESGQLGHPGRRCWQNRHAGQAHHHHRRGAQRRAGALPLAGAAGV